MERKEAWWGSVCVCAYMCVRACTLEAKFVYIFFDFWKGILNCKLVQLLCSAILHSLFLMLTFVFILLLIWGWSSRLHTYYLRRYSINEPVAWLRVAGSMPHSLICFAVLLSATSGNLVTHGTCQNFFSKMTHFLLTGQAGNCRHQNSREAFISPLCLS